MASKSTFYASKLHLLGLVLINAMCGVYASWNVSFEHGLGYELITNGILALAMLVYNCCMSEISSTFPFPGGSYAMARCTLGFYPGYLAGCCEIFYSILSFTYTNIAIIYFFTLFYPELTSSYALVILFVTILLQVCICGGSRKVFWTAIALFASLTVGFNFSYALGFLGNVDFSQYAYTSLSTDSAGHIRKTLFVGSGFNVLRNITSLIWCYAGPEFVNLTCDDVERPRRQIPFAQVTGIIIVILHNTAVALVACSISPGAEGISNLQLPLNPGNEAKVFAPLKF
jgi:ethanolamine permease